MYLFGLLFCGELRLALRLLVAEDEEADEEEEEGEEREEGRKD